MKGRTPKSRKRKPTKTPVNKAPPDSVSSPATEESNALSGQDAGAVNQTIPSPSQLTPIRCRRQLGQIEAHQTSTPVHTTDSPPSISTSAGVKSRLRRRCLQDSELFSSLKTSEEDSPCSKSACESRCKRGRTVQPRQTIRTQRQTCSKGNGAQTKQQRGSKQKTQTKQDSATQPSKRCRPRFELKKPDAEEPDDSVLSSDLSIELSHHEDQIPYLSFLEDQENDYEEEEDDDELPSFLMQANNKPSSITDGAFVWHKFRNFPFWPALVKRVNRKMKKASIMFVEDSIIQGKKGFTVGLRTLKPFDCEEAKELVRQAKEKYSVAIELSMDLIQDYRIRKACGSFSGSFIEYYAHDMSYPVRRKYPQAASQMLSFGSVAMMDDTFDDHKEDCSGEQLKKVSKSSKRLLPDRTHAAHNRANEKLVHFIVKQHMVDQHILAVIRGQQQSRWLRSFLGANQKRVVDVYLEDEKQLDQVYQYLNNLYTTAADNALSLVKLKTLDRVRFVLDVLLPEAIIYAIAGVDNVSIKKAEEKYLKGRSASPRERQEFDQMIDHHMRIKAQNTALAQLSEPMN